MRSRGREKIILGVCSLCSRSLLSREAFPQLPVELISSCIHQLDHSEWSSSEKFSYQLKVTSTPQVSPSHPRYNLTPGTAEGLQDPTPGSGITTILIIHGYAARLITYLEYQPAGDFHRVSEEGF